MWEISKVQRYTRILLLSSQIDLTTDLTTENDFTVPKSNEVKKGEVERSREYKKIS